MQPFVATCFVLLVRLIAVPADFQILKCSQLRALTVPARPWIDKITAGLLHDWNNANPDRAVSRLFGIHGAPCDENMDLYMPGKLEYPTSPT